jgi:hypothetical protein
MEDAIRVINAYLHNLLANAPATKLQESFSPAVAVAYKTENAMIPFNISEVRKAYDSLWIFARDPALAADFGDIFLAKDKSFLATCRRFEKWKNLMRAELGFESVSTSREVNFFVYLDNCTIGETQ